VAITFDDGLASDYETSVPTLVEQGLCADFFINTARVGSAGYVTWDQLREMTASNMGIHSHSHDHVALSRLSRESLENQLRCSKQMLEDRLGTVVGFLAVPYGFVNQRVVDVALALGYRAVCDSFNWPARTGARQIHRVAIHANTSMQEFTRLLSGNPAPYLRRAVRSALTYAPKEFLLRYRPGRLGVEVLEKRA
jgi:peptidoglycan/xylan/chitin deacetylase (PgdA/CDA1 family)